MNWVFVVLQCHTGKHNLTDIRVDHIVVVQSSVKLSQKRCLDPADRHYSVFIC